MPNLGLELQFLLLGRVAKDNNDNTNTHTDNNDSNDDNDNQ